jgi:hypothetical protein
MWGGVITRNSAAIGGGIYNSGGQVGIYGGEIYDNTENGVYNSAKLEVSGSAKILDPIYILSSHYPLELGNLSYHKDSKHPIRIQAFNGITVAMSDNAGDLLNNGILISDIPGSSLELSNSKSITMSGTSRFPMIDENAEFQKLTLYPTVVTSGGMLTIDSPDGGDASIWNMLGSVVGQYKLGKGMTKITAPFIRGNYIVNVRTGTEKEKVVKIIVK